MFRKRDIEGISGRAKPSRTFKNSTLFFKSIQSKQDTALKRTQIILDYVLSNSGNDKRPYLEVKILGRKFLCLLDSGASVTTAGNKAYRSLLQLGLRLEKTKDRVCKVADGREVPMLGTVSTPVTLQTCTKLLDIAIVPELPHGLILGLLLENYEHSTKLEK